MGEMIDDLVEAQKTATAFLVQEPPTGDHFSDLQQQLKLFVNN